MAVAGRESTKVWCFEYSDAGGAHPVGLLDPIVRAELDKRGDDGPADPNILGAQVCQNFAITDDTVIFFIGQGM